MIVCIMARVCVTHDHLQHVRASCVRPSILPITTVGQGPSLDSHPKTVCARIPMARLQVRRNGVGNISDLRSKCVPHPPQQHCHLRVGTKLRVRTPYCTTAEDLSQRSEIVRGAVKYGFIVDQLSSFSKMISKFRLQK